MKEQIIVSIDPLNIQQGVVDYALELARASRKQLLLYSVQGMPVLAEADGGMAAASLDYVPGVMEETKRLAEELYERVKAQYPNTLLEQGLGFQTSATIQKMEEVEHEPGASAMLVMQKSSGHNWWNNAVGTTETSVAGGVSYPVLFVPEGAAYSGISRVMYLADTQALLDGKYKGFRFLKRFASMHAAHIVVGFIFDPDAGDHRQLGLGEAMDEFRKSLPFQFSHEYRFFLNQQAEEILEMANVTHTDILAFPFREAGFFQRLFETEITRSLLLKADMPVLVF